MPFVNRMELVGHEWSYPFCSSRKYSCRKCSYQNTLVKAKSRLLCLTIQQFYRQVALGVGKSETGRGSPNTSTMATSKYEHETHPGGGKPITHSSE